MISLLPSTSPINVTNAAMASPVMSSLLPITAASATELCETSALSTSAVEILCPEIFITSSTRPNSQT